MKNKTTHVFTSLVIFALFLSGCTMLGGSETDLKTALAAEGRSETDKQRDAGRKPAEVIKFLGIEKGMVVMDVIAAGGYYTEVLSYAVGESGVVYAQNPEFVLKFRDGANDKAMSARLENNRLPNVKRWDREVQDLGIDNGSLDVAITALNLHDVYNRSPDDVVALLVALKATLKSGGVLGVIDHHGNEGNDNNALHRMQMAQAIDVAKQAGFTVESSDLLENSNDDRSKMVFAQEIRGNTDRFLLKLTKP